MNQHECFDGGLQLLVVRSDDVVMNDVRSHVLGKAWLAADDPGETIVGLCYSSHFAQSEFQQYKPTRYQCQ
jgi:hypothetical protein